MFSIPAIINNEYVYTLEKDDVVSVDGRIIAQSSMFPLIRLSQVKRLGEESFRKFQSIPIRDIICDLKKAADVFKQMEFEIGDLKIREGDYVRLVSESTGLTPDLVRSEIHEIADILYNIENILKVQIPGDIEEVLDNNRYLNHGTYTGYYPAGKTLAVKLPGNIPTICLYWLIPFAQKRPIFLIPPKEDLFTHLLLVEAIKKVNPLLSSFISFLPCNNQFQSNLYNISDQILLPESSKSVVENNLELMEKTYFIHYGRSKFLITDQYKLEFSDILFRKMMWNNGRTCTGLTSVITTNSADVLTHDLSTKLIRECEYDIEGKIPAFSLKRARLLNNMIDEFVSKGEVLDITSNIRNKPRLVEINNKGIIFPTVLLVKNKKSGAFGLELPFPFVSVIQIEENEIIEYAKNTLIMSVISGKVELVKDLCYEKSILKIFSGANVERGYNYLDPHEGYMLDFLNHKKAVLL
ncbi:MAG: hypothetical protein BWY74_02009 [Firmicutes bacterium ADurb.Bin419]|jgi:thienamycin biosynthesis protein ThnO|nr:MAG: hypothetical protein BWY74_02009 [Firmicutes bacterium ADurb.Bin419]